MSVDYSTEFAGGIRASKLYEEKNGKAFLAGLEVPKFAGHPEEWFMEVRDCQPIFGKENIELIIGDPAEEDAYCLEDLILGKSLLKVKRLSYVGNKMAEISWEELVKFQAEIDQLFAKFDAKLAGKTRLFLLGHCSY